ncbi:hypothetical protein PRIPAC_76864 [Pristionchus pacificus]|uniref:glutathione transferase n=1 Tax=Pristionchus pacificus TaxID=54126 RepID=A0A2A6C3N4_PRIPA|nr:hypothetical protein PRIPAC_76864 [Pristionchus pacificus]|eukprot:PDM72631.1 Glutathione S-transferase [Pristionchus pacificus]
MPTYKLTYWDARALAEVSRQLFALSETPFEDNRIKRDQWESEYKKDSPFGKIPILEVDGKKLPQSHAIARYLARKFGPHISLSYSSNSFFPISSYFRICREDSIREGVVDAIADQFKDFYTDHLPFFVVLTGLKDGDLSTLRIEVGEPARDKFFEYIEQIAKKNGSGYLVGRSVTWADLLIVDYMFTLESKAPGYLDGFPTMKKVKKSVENTPKLKEYLAKRPNNAF